MTDPSYWIGPYGVLVPYDIYRVPAEDGGNSVSREGIQTLMRVLGGGLNENEWKEKYAYQENGVWFYKRRPTKTLRQARDELARKYETAQNNYS